MFVRLRSKKAQNIVEYLLLSLAVVVIMISFLSRRGQYAQTVNKVLKQTGHIMDERAKEVDSAAKPYVLKDW